MCKAFRFLISVILLLLMVDLTYADSAGDTAEARQAGVILEAGEIDSSTVEMGAFTVVIHGQEKRDPVSRDWESLSTKTVDSETLTRALGRDGRRKRIAVDRIQTLVLVGSHFQRLAIRDGMNTTGRTVSKAESFPKKFAVEDSIRIDLKLEAAPVAEPAPGPADADSTQADRVAAKLGVGFLGGVGGAAGGFGVGFLLGWTSVCGSGGEEDFGGCAIGPAIYGGLPIGYVAGVAAGVSMLDPHDSFRYSLIGSVTGLGAGIGLAYGLEPIIGNPFIGSFVSSAIIFGPIGLATALSEWSRDPPEARFSVGLKPSPRGHLSAVASLRF